MLIVIDIFSKFGKTIPLKNKYAQTKTLAISDIIKSSERKPNLLETDDGKETVNNILKDFLKQNIVKGYSRYALYFTLSSI